MEDNKLYSLIWKLLAVAVCTFIVSVSGCTAYESSLVRDMVKAGADPMAARCATSPGSSVVLCAIVAAKP